MYSTHILVAVLLASVAAATTASFEKLREDFKEQIKADPTFERDLREAHDNNIPIPFVRRRNAALAAARARQQEAKVQKVDKSRKQHNDSDDSKPDYEELALNDDAWFTIDVEKPARKHKAFRETIRLSNNAPLLIEAVALGRPGHSFVLHDETRDREILRTHHVPIKKSTDKHPIEASFNAEANYLDSKERFSYGEAVVVPPRRGKLDISVQELLPHDRKKQKILKKGGKAGVALRVSEIRANVQDTKNFFLIDEPHVPWFAAEKACKALGGTVARISRSNAKEATQLVRSVLGPKGIAYVLPKRNVEKRATYFIEGSEKGLWSDKKKRRYSLSRHRKSKKHRRHGRRRHYSSSSGSYSSSSSSASESTESSESTKSVLSNKIQRSYFTIDLRPNFLGAPLLCMNVSKKSARSRKSESRKQSSKPDNKQ